MQSNRKPHPRLSAIARAAFVGAVSVAGILAQAPPVAPHSQQMVAAAERLCRASDPITRGEAALVLAGNGDTKHHVLVLAVAKDPAPEARIRGLLALGLLGAPGCEHVLREQIEASGTRAQPEGITAAFALGRLPDAMAPALVSDQLGRVLGASFKRQHDVLLALLLGLTTHAATAQRLALQQLLDSKSLRDSDLRVATLLALANIPKGLGCDRWSGILTKGPLEERRTVLQCMPKLDCTTALQSTAIELCRRDPDPLVRAQSLAALTHVRHPLTLELARKAIASTDPEEAGQAARTLWQLGGSAVAAELGTALQLATPAVQAAMLTNYVAPMDEPTLALVQQLATARSLSQGLRSAAALALGRAESKAAAPLLRDAFLATQDTAMLTLMAPVLLRLDAVPSLARLHAGSSDTELALQPERLLALLLAAHPDAEPFCLRVVSQKGQPEAAIQGVLRAWRSRSLAQLLPDATARWLPSPLRELR